MGQGFVKTFGLGLAVALGSQAFAGYHQMENLGRGLAVAGVESGVYLTWRLLGTEAPTTAFNVYRDGKLIAEIDSAGATSYLDASGSTSSSYSVAAVTNGVEGDAQAAEIVFSELTGYDETATFGEAYFPYKTITLNVPDDDEVNGTSYSYTANDMSVGDLDGDGEYELIVKWDPSNSQDNSVKGYTGKVIVDAYEFDGTQLWRIDLGVNIRAGAHYTQFMVYDFDGDGKAEVAMKTSDGTVDGQGNVIGDASADYRTSKGLILSGNEYLTMFDGETGAAITSVDFVPSRSILSSSSWGDSYGNRCERYLAGVAYLDGQKPSLIMARGYYTAAFVTAWDFDGENLTQRWYHESTTSKSGLYGEGNHNLAIGDIDGDGKDEIVYGAAALNYDGTLLYRTGFGHGDAMHLSDLDPDLDGLEVWDVHEETSASYGYEMRGPSGNVIFGAKTGTDNGRGLAADIDSTRGFEMWSYGSYDVFDCKGNSISTNRPSLNFRIYFDGDYYDELFDKTESAEPYGGKIEKWNISTQSVKQLFSVYAMTGATTNNTTKGTPGIVADIFGDWREELIMRSGDDDSKIFIFTTPFETEHRVYTLMHDPVYRVSVAWQNTAYNQPPHLGYYLPDAVENLTQPEVYTIDSEGNRVNYPAPTLTKNGAGGSKQTITLGDSIVDFAYAYAYCDGALVTGMPAGIDTATNTAQGKIYISGAPTEAGIFNYTVSTVGGYGDAATVSRQIIVYDTTATGETDSSSIDLNASTTTASTSENDSTTAIAAFANYKVGYNPVSGYFRANVAGTAEVEVYSLSGKLVARASKAVNPGATQMEFGREQLPNGAYYATAKLNGRTVSRKSFTLAR